eukprot:Gb_41089 [translate_table: standard]
MQIPLFMVAAITLMAMAVAILIFRPYYWSGRGPAAPLPPGSLGLPVLGEYLQFQWTRKSNKPQRFFDERVGKCGHVFKTGLIGHPTVVATGPSGNRLILSNENKLVVGSWPTSLVKLIGRQSILSKSGDDYKRIPASLMAFLAPEALQNHVGKMSGVIQHHLDVKWKAQAEVKILPLLIEIVSLGAISIPFDFPGTRYRRAKLSRSKLDKILLSLLQKRKNDLLHAQTSTSYDQDLLSALLTVKGETGEDLTTQEIIDNISVLMHAGFDTTTSALTMMFKLLSSNKASYEKIAQEQLQILSSKGEGEEMTWEDTRKMKYTWQALQETMHIFPPIFGTFCRAVTDIKYDGYTIPSGWKLLWTVYSTHMKEEYFDKPEEFRPSRFAEEAKVRAHTYLPFGEGIRMCPGMEFAKMELVLIMHYFVRTFRDYSAVEPNEMITFDPLPFSCKRFPRQTRFSGLKCDI